MDDRVLATVVERAANPFLLLEPDGRIAWVSDTIEDIVGRTAEQVVGTSILDWLDVASREVAISTLADMGAVLATGPQPRQTGTGLLVNVSTSAGGWVACETALATPSRTGLDHFVLQIRTAGSSSARRATLRAMGEDRPVGEVLTHVATMLESAVGGSLVEVGVGGPDHLRAFHPATTAVAADLDEAREQGPWVEAMREAVTVSVSLDQVSPATAARAREVGMTQCWSTPVAAEGDAEAAVVVLWLDGDGVEPSVARTHQVVAEASELVGVVLGWDAGRRALRFAARHDPLTGLPNRRSLDDQLTTELSGTVLYIDLDDFKSINDQHGHAAGDAVLRTVADRLRAVVRPDDLVVRVGGDELVVLCSRTPAGAGAVLVERIHGALADPVIVDHVPLRVGASIGVVSDAPGRSLGDALGLADDLMRDAKRAGKGRSRRVADPPRSPEVAEVRRP